MKILNLYAGIGGNRKLWSDEHEITAVEWDEKIASVYKDYFPNDHLIIGDAHEFLPNHFEEFDLIWSSPPCQSHASFRQNICVRYRGSQPIYPDLSLYQEIIFLQYNFKGKYVVENVNPYYKPLIQPTIKLDRHFFWSNIDIADAKFERPAQRRTQIPDLQELLGYDLSNYKIPNKRQALRNCVQPMVGKHILDCMLVHV